MQKVLALTSYHVIQLNPTNPATGSYPSSTERKTTVTIKVTLEFANAEDAITALARYRDMLPSLMASDKKAETPAPKPAPAADKNAASKPTADKKETTKTDAAETKPGTSSASSAASASDAYEAVKAAIQKAVLIDKPAVIALLKKFNPEAKSGKDLKPEQYAEFLTEIATVGAAEEDLS